MSKNWIFKKNIGLGLNFTYEFEVCYIQNLAEMTTTEMSVSSVQGLESKV